MNSLFSARLVRLSTILIPLTILMGCGEGDGQARIFNEPAEPYAGPPDSCFEVLDFEDICGISYDFAEFEGGPGVIVPVADEPLIAGDAGNTSDKVIKAIKARATSGAVFGGFVMDVEGSPAPFTFAPGTTVTMKVWSQRQVNLLVEPEGGGTGSGDEVTHSGTGWEELTFTFPSFSGTTSGFVFIFDLGTNGDFGNDPDNWTFFIDDVSVPEGDDGGPGPSGGFPITFDDASPPAVTEFGGAGYAIEPGPTGGDGNALKIVRDGGDNFAGAFVTVPEIPDDQGEQTISAFVYSPTADIPMVVKAEYGENMGTGDVSANETVVVGWQTLTWTFTNLEPGNAYNRFVILPNLGTVDSGASYFFDNIDLVGGEPPAGCAEGITFEPECGFEYGYTNFEGGVSTVVDNPDQAGINPSATVVQMQKFRAESGFTYGGTTLTFSPPRDALDVVAGSSFTVKVWSQRPVNVLFQPEPAGPGNDVEVAHGGTGWEELTFDLGGFADTVTGWTFIFDNGTLGDAEADPSNWTFYYDDISNPQSGGGGGGGDGATALPANFEADPASYDFGPDGGFEGGAASVVTNPDQSGINTSTQVGQMLKFPGAVFGGATLAIEPTTVTAGSSFTMKVWSQRPVPVLLQPEPQGPGSGIEVSHGGTGWEELTFSLPGLSGTVSGITIIFENGTAGAADTDPTNWTFYFDDITLVSPDGGGGGSDPVSVSDFEADPATYDFGPDSGFEGGVSTVVANPDQSGINTSAQVARMQKFPGAVFGGSTLTLGTPLDVLAGSTFTMKVWSQRPVNVLFQPEPQGPGSGVEVTHGGTGWEELTFSFPNLSGTVTGITVIFDNGTAGAADTDPDNWTFYYDDITLLPGDGGGGGGGGATTLPVDFQGDVNSYDFGPFGGFEGGAASVVTNPDQSGINTSTQVGQMLKFNGAVFGGATLAIEPATVEAGSSFTMKVWSQRLVPVLLQPEPQGPGSGVEVTHGGTGWEELTFSLPALSGTVSGITIIFDNGTAGAAATDPTNWTFYFDDITLLPPDGGGGGGSETALPVDFQGDAASYDFGPDGGFEGGAASVVTNPDQSGINTSTQVGQMLKFPGAVFGGATLAIESTTVEAGSSFTMKVWSQRAVPVLLQPEPQGPGSGVEVTHGGTGWEELTFSLPGLSGTVSGITIIFDNGTAGAADTDPTNWTFYFDDIALVPGDGGGGGVAATLPVDFQGDAASYDFGPDGGFEGGAASVVTNPDQSGINTSTQVGQMLKFPGAVFGGATLAIESTTVEAGSSFTMKVWSQRAVPVLLQPEPQGPGSGVEVTHGGTGWEELTFSLPGLSGTVSGITIIFDNGTAGAADTDPTNWTFYFDDITLVPPDGGGGGSDPVSVSDFEADAASYDFGPDGGFEGGVSTVVANPDQSGINTSAQVAQMQKFPGAVFGGSTLQLASSLDVLAGSTFTMKVWSQRPVNVLFQPEPQGPGSGVEVTHGGTGWEELTFSFPNLSGTVTGITVIFDNGTAGAADTDPTNWTFYYDDITLLPGDGSGGGATTLPVDFEGDVNSYDFGPFGGFEGGAASVVTNPDQSGINTSAQVGQMLKFDGAVFGGATLAIEPATVTAGSSFTMKVWSQRAVPVLLQPEPQGPGSGVEVTHGGTGWEELTFPLPSLSGTVSGITIIFDNGTAGEAATDPTNWTFYFDDITLVPGDGGGGGSGSGDFPITFDSGTPPAVTDFGGSVYFIEPGPAGGDGNALKIVRDGGTTFAGAWIAVTEIPNDAGAQTISALAYSPTAGIPMVAKVEYGDNMGTGDVSANEAVVVGWQTLTWTFTNLAPGNVYNRFTILPNLGTVDTATSYYFDNITLVGAGGGGGGGGGGGTGDLVVDGGFEAAGTSGLQPPWFVFENGGTVSVSNANDNGGDYSARLQADASSGTSFPILKIERVGAGSVTGGESVTISFDVIDVDTAGAGKTFVAELFTEKADPPGGATNEILLGGYDLTSTWQTRVFDTNLAADAAGGVSLLFKADCGGNTSCTMDVFIDNVSIVIN